MSLKNSPWWYNRGRRTKLLCGLALLLVLLSVSASFVSVNAFQTMSGSYRHGMALGEDGLQHLQQAQALLQSLPLHPFDASAVHLAQQEFTAASADFVQVDGMLRAYPEVMTAVPLYGARFRVALHLVSLGMWLSQAGIVTCNLLNLLIPKFATVFKTSEPGLSEEDLVMIDTDFYQVRLAVEGSIAEVRHLRPTDLLTVPRLSNVLATFQQRIYALRDWLDDIEELLPALPTLLGIGTPANYLVELLDTTELRPAGGFIGNYGFVTLSSGQVVGSHVSDVDLLDGPFYASGQRIPFPNEYHWLSHYLSLDSWSFRDSNLDADFPTSARNAELNYSREGGNVPVEGVVAITTAAVQLALSVTGPIYLPEYQETITAQNLIDRIHYHQLGAGQEGSGYVPAPDGHSSLRKHFTALLAEHFVARIHHLSSQDLARLMQALLNAVHTKDIQVYLNTPAAEDLLQRAHLDSSIQPDSFFVVDANVSGDKVNHYLVNTLDDQVTLTTEGDAIHRTTLSYTWAIPGETYGSDLYRNYVRVYAPPHSSLTTQAGWTPLGTGDAFGHTVWSGDFTLRCCQTRTITLLWTEADAVKFHAGSWMYRYSIQRQAGEQRTLNLQLRLPACATRAQVWGGLLYQPRKDPTLATLSRPLVQDSTVGVQYSCSQ